jgi:nucleoside-diphosphate-sugar epimerase
MKILLAGATGAIGRLLVPLLMQAGHEVVGTTRNAAKAPLIAAAGGRPLLVDALDRPALLTALAAERPDVVMHQLTDLSQRNFAGNSHLRVAGTRNLVDAALAVGVARMITQSIAWIYEPGQGPAQEHELLDLGAPPPRGETVAAVHALEAAVAEMPVGLVLRYGLFYGPGTWYARDGLTTTQIQHGEIPATDGVVSFIHVADAAQAALQALDWPAGAYNIVDDEPATEAAWAPFYAHLVGAPLPAYKPGAQGWERGAANAKARALGWTPRFPSWRAGFVAVLG